MQCKMQDMQENGNGWVLGRKKRMEQAHQKMDDRRIVQQKRNQRYTMNNLKV